ncbi:cyclin-dependent kinase G-2-like [Salvia hispanica]|uniref:cyclin-dependent kinase G-2-like n=1 Tax=Salvia hispanica TaxID=49212 RepID=UPI00200977A8|nr:cyclin-dependent kinase G-2-like [Salvia hispanica]
MPLVESFLQTTAPSSQPQPQQNRYQVLNVVSRGSYGVVYRAWDTEAGEIVAIKHELTGLSRSTLREIKILQSLPRHRSIVELKKVTVDERGKVLVVMEFMPSDLSRLIAARKKPFTAPQLKVSVWRILKGVLFLHENGVLHRDLKPSNILINQKDRIKICDFGLSRWESESGSYSPEVGTQWYRAPELLMGKTNYTGAIDMWAVGCVMAELVLLKALFPGNSEIQQLGYIHLTLGPALQLMLSVSVPMLTPAGLDLLISLLAFDPNDRITAKDALQHPWFLEF